MNEIRGGENKALLNIIRHQEVLKPKWNKEKKWLIKYGFQC